MAGILGILVMFILIKLCVRLFKSIGKDVKPQRKKREIIDDINIKPKRTKKP